MNVFLKKKKPTEKLKLVLPGSKENKNYWYRLLVIQCLCLYRYLAALTTFGTSKGSLLVTSGCNWVLPAHRSIQRQTRGNEKYFQDSKEVTEETKDISPFSYKIIILSRALSLKNKNQKISWMLLKSNGKVSFVKQNWQWCWYSIFRLLWGFCNCVTQHF